MTPADRLKEPVKDLHLCLMLRKEAAPLEGDVERFVSQSTSSDQVDSVAWPSSFSDLSFSSSKTVKSSPSTENCFKQNCSLRVHIVSLTTCAMHIIHKKLAIAA